MSSVVKGSAGRTRNHRVEQIVDAASVLSGDGEHLLDAEAVKIVDQRRLLFAVDFVDCEEKRPVGLAQQADQFEVGAGEFGASVDHHDDGGGFVERDARLTVDFGRDQVFLFGQNAAGVDDAQMAAAPLGVAVEAVAGDAGFVADNGAARAHDAVEERGLADIGAAHDGDRGDAGGGGGESAGRIVSRLRQNQFVACGDSRRRPSLGFASHDRVAEGDCPGTRYYRGSCGSCSSQPASPLRTSRSAPGGKTLRSTNSSLRAECSRARIRRTNFAADSCRWRRPSSRRWKKSDT